MFEYQVSPNPVFKFVAGFGIILIVTAPILLFAMLTMPFSGTGEGGEYWIVSSTPSPDGKNAAIIYAGQGGGAAGWSFLRTTVHPADKPFNPESENNYIFEMKDSKPAPVWNGNSDLIILYSYKPGKADTYYRKESYSINTGVSVKYVGNPVE